jgi:hypothetical protein
MRHRIAVGSSLALMLLVGGVIAADDVKSGPQVGENATPKPFNPLHVNGPDSGKKVCLV